MKIILASKSPARKKLLSQLGLKFEVVPADIDEDKIREKTPSQTVKKIAFLKANYVLKNVFNRYTTVDHLLTICRKFNKLLIISADTMVYLLQGIPTVYGVRQLNHYIGKPKDKNDAKHILATLSGTTHWLYSGICVIYISSPCHSRSRVRHGTSSNRESIEYSSNEVRSSHRQLAVRTMNIDSRLRGNDNRKRSIDVRVFTDFDKSKVTFRKLSEKEIDKYVKNNDVHLWAGAYTIEKGTAGASFIKKIKGSSSNVLGLPVKKLKKILGQIDTLVSS